MQITRFAVHQTAKVVALLYLCFTIIFIPFFLTVAFAGEDLGAMRWFFLFAPVVYGVLGYLFTAFACVLYNVLAKRVGGIEFTLVDSKPTAAPTYDSSVST
jgi:hypothetical protein